jgi:ribose transport system substrate-binding protein
MTLLAHRPCEIPPTRKNSNLSQIVMLQFVAEFPNLSARKDSVNSKEVNSMRPNTARMSALLAIAVLSAGLGLTPTALAQEKSKTHIKVAIFSVNGDAPTIHAMIEAASADAKSRGWDVETFDGHGDMVAVNNQANTYVARGFDALINVASDNGQLGGVIAKAKKAGIPFVSTFSGLAPGITVDIGDNHVVDGAIAAAELAARIDGQGSVVKLNWNVLPALQERDRGFHAVMAGYPKIVVKELEVKVPGQVEDAYNKVTNLLQGDTNHEIRAFWGGFDYISAAAARAVQKAKRGDIFVVSMDGDEGGLDMIREGTPLVLTVGYDVAGMGHAAVQAVADAVDGKHLPARQIYKKPCLFMKSTLPPAGGTADYKTCGLFSADMSQ